MAVLVQTEMFQKGKVGLLIELSENMDIANHLVTLAVGHYLKLFFVIAIVLIFISCQTQFWFGCS